MARESSFRWWPRWEVVNLGRGVCGVAGDGLFFLGIWARETGGVNLFDGEESSDVEGLLGGDPALGAFPVFWVQGMVETLGNVGGLIVVVVFLGSFLRMLGTIWVTKKRTMK